MGWFSAIMFFASMAIQQVQARKIRRAQEAAAEAAKGFQMVRSGESAPIPIIYGRNKVGGSRVYHNTFSDYAYLASYETTLAANGAVVLIGNNVTALIPPVDLQVLAYFAAPAGINPQLIANTEGYASAPKIVTIDRDATSNGGNGEIGFGTESSMANDAASHGGRDPG